MRTLGKACGSGVKMALDYLHDCFKKLHLFMVGSPGKHMQDALTRYTYFIYPHTCHCATWKVDSCTILFSLDISY